MHKELPTDGSLMMSTLSTAKMTSEQFLMMGEDPPGVRFELVNGEIVVSPSPNSQHSAAVVNLVKLLGGYIDEHNLGQLLIELDTVLSGNTTRRPDLLFVSRARAKIVREVVHGAPDLCIEVISPTSATVDRVDKFALYAQSGVKYYWLIDPHAQMIEAFSLKAGKYVLAVMARGTETVHLPPFPGLSISLKRVWAKS
jgi:Uma2 family endonuclease